MEDQNHKADLAVPTGTAESLAESFGPRPLDAEDLAGDMLSLLSSERIFAVHRHGHGFHFYERCDEYFGVTITREQLLKLADELRDIAMQKPTSSTMGADQVWGAQRLSDPKR